MDEYRVGQGIDVHPLVLGRRLVLGGVEIPFDRGLEGHSDADVLLHAVIDAVLGATGRGDIGTYFPDTEPQWKDARSTMLLERVMHEVFDEGWKVVNLDCTILAQVPKLIPYIPRMKEMMGELLHVATSQIAVKATTTERLGAIGREEGIAVLAVCMMRRVFS